MARTKPRPKLTSERILSERQVRTLLKELTLAKDQALASGERSGFVIDYYLIKLALQTGLRISELAALTWDCIHDDFLIVERGKGGKRREVVFGKRTSQLLAEFKALNQPHPSRRLFCGERGPYTRYGLHQRWSFWKRRLNLPAKITFHSCRHYSATFMLNQGIDLATVRDQLGHSNISVTSTYLHFTEASRERLRAVL